MLLAILSLSSCGIYTNYHRPESLPVDSLYRDVPKAIQDTASLADLSWRELFTDSLLVKWIEVGLEKNSDIQTARLLTEEAQASLQASRLAFLPSVSLAPQGSLNSFGGTKPTKTYSLGGTAEWEIDAFGGLRNAKKGSRAALEANRAYEQAVQTQLVATIAETYYSLLALDRKLDITRETAHRWEENVRTMKALKRAGERDDAAVAQAEASRLEAESAVLSLEKQIHELGTPFRHCWVLCRRRSNGAGCWNSHFRKNCPSGFPCSCLADVPTCGRRNGNWPKHFMPRTKHARHSILKSR